jgi:ABC-type Zn uptake system ZnuABC Zn-binding protein ZnuA
MACVQNAKKPKENNIMRQSLRMAFLSLLCLCAGCRASTGGNSPSPKVIAVENFLADIAQNTAGDRLTVGFLMPYGIDPHEFEPVPKDAAAVSESAMLIVNGGGLEGWLSDFIKNIRGTKLIVTASEGLTNRIATPFTSGVNPTGGALATPIAPLDPHFWLDPNLVKTYVQNILSGLIQIDPSGSDDYTQNAESYLAQLDDLDGWIRAQVSKIPQNQRLLVTNHESLGYFADRYGFQIVGSILQSVSSVSEPSPAQLADLIQLIRSTGVKAIFLEAGTNSQLADQIASETGVRVVTDLYTHSLTPPEGPAPTYIKMMEYNVSIIVDALL